MSLSALSVTLNTQVIRVLGGPPIATMSESQLLSALQARYPTQGWTESLLSQVLLVGARQGRYVRATCQPVVLWTIRTTMLQLDPVANAPYSDLTSQIAQNAPVPCSTAAFDTANAPFVPDSDPITSSWL